MRYPPTRLSLQLSFPVDLAPHASHVRVANGCIGKSQKGTNLATTSDEPFIRDDTPKLQAALQPLLTAYLNNTELVLPDQLIGVARPTVVLVQPRIDGS